MSISIALEHKLIGGHVHVKVRAGNAGSRGLCGSLIMRPEEWQLFEALMLAGAGARDVDPDLVEVRRVWADDGRGWWPDDDLVVINPDGWTPGNKDAASLEAMADWIRQVIRLDEACQGTGADMLTSELYISGVLLVTRPTKEGSNAMPELAVMDQTGDTKTIWDPDKPDEVAAAKATFDALKKKRYVAYSVDEKGEADSVIREFDPKAGKIIMSPPMQGG